MKHIIIYDKEGVIISQYSSTDIRIPVGVPYIILEDFNFDYESDTYKHIIGVDVSVEPNIPIYGKSAYELRYEKLTLEELQNERQEENKKALAEFLKNNPVLWIDGLYYGVTQEDQNEMIADKTAYDVKHAMGDTSWKLQWHSIHSDCRDFTEEEFIGLLNVMTDFVYPYRQLEMKYKKAIYDATTKEEVVAIDIVYELPQEEDTSTEEEVEGEEIIIDNGNDSATTEESTESGDVL